jgi:transposase
MDLGDENHKVIGLSESGEIVLREEVPCTPAGVRALLKAHPDALLAVETGTHCRWVSRVGLELGREVLVGNARKLRVIWESSRKNDWRDAEMLAKVARADRSLLHPVKLRGDGDQGLMRLVKARDLLVKGRTGVVNQLRGFCKSEGAPLRKCSAASFPRLKGDVPPAVREVAKPLFAVLEELSKKIGLYDAMIADAVRRLHGEEAALLEPIAGVGPVTAAAFLAAVGDPATFGSARDAGPYFGLAPARDQSGGKDPQKKISKEGNALVRRLLVTASSYIMGPFGPDCDLRRHGLRIAERGGMNARKRARVAVARKLAVLMLAILRDKSEYRPLTKAEAVA